MTGGDGMNENNNKNDGFADIIIPGGDNAESKGYRIPENSSGKYAGKGAYSLDKDRFRAVETLESEYNPHLSFINKVQIYTWGAKRSFYERFREDAKRYREMKGEPCEEVPFFSYIPQYSQMNLYQSNFYLYFRECVKKDNFIHADLSYILLYVYEIINLLDESNPEEDVEILCKIWMGYRDFYPVLDKYMSEWVCDYCLLCGLPVPECTLAVLPKLCECATLREFYMSGAVKEGRVMQGEVLEAFADYDRRRSRVELDEKYTHHFPRALEAACAIFPKDHFVGESPTVVKRDAFCGSLCSHNVKRKIAVEYYPAFRRSGVRHMLGGAVKHIENKIRRAMGLKSRLHTDGLPDNVKVLIDRYFEEEMPEIFKRKSSRTDTVPEYEKFYDAPSIPFSADAAYEIERESRAAAELLASMEPYEDEIHETPVESGVTEPEPEMAARDSKISANVDNRAAIAYVLEGGSLEEWCRNLGLLPDTVAGEINEAAMDAYGDVLLEHDGTAWQIIVDYLEEAAEMAVGE